jgi:5-methylcytosine-specific restriction endonuclease McrA
MLRIEETEFELIRPSNKPKEKEILFKKQNGLCALCKLPIKKGGGTIDHILPKGKGGSSHISNKQLAHYYCNNAKGDSTELLSPTRYQDLALQLKEKVYAKRKKRGKGQLEKSYLSSIL